ncbi:zinc finger, SWIM-type, MULE transposase domain, FHY3/FAR1 family [Artemisia annua]|uniref:Zinc finger, SWIM-type, MULE transposase domain, FHY3/FAR1 family n=1 Tax=Artemisia annua TaxID=35608 RepID=A0A2U1PFE8_ARTAN|nr:zinc finger, SWIM-type, MULE transposase domain, FHY3/FAR1 family [Artemisia annua]
MSVSVSDVDSGKKYVIQDTGEDEKLSRRHRIVKGKPLYDFFYEVLCKPSEEFYQCTCKRFESYGLLCGHIFYVIRLSKVKTFPRKYVLRRWSQDSLPPASVIQASGDTPDMILREIFRSVEYCVNHYTNEPELLQKFRDHQVQLMAKADADVPIPKKTNKRDRIASILG